MGEQETDSGEFSVGETVKIAYVDQSHSNIENKSIWENFADGQELIMMGGKQVNSRAYLSF
jgi:ATPase subunit of ABC transporter with duplicated ATPase domains